jgi:RIO-like serine/threonine protein kinase
LGKTSSWLLKRFMRGKCLTEVSDPRILVRPDNSVVVIDFESSVMDADPDLLNLEMRKVKYLLRPLKPIDLAS